VKHPNKAPFGPHRHSQRGASTALELGSPAGPSGTGSHSRDGNPARQTRQTANPAFRYVCSVHSSKALLWLGLNSLSPAAWRGASDPSATDATAGATRRPDRRAAPHRACTGRSQQVLQRERRRAREQRAEACRALGLLTGTPRRWLGLTAPPRPSRPLDAWPPVLPPIPRWQRCSKCVLHHFGMTNTQAFSGGTWPPSFVAAPPQAATACCTPLAASPALAWQTSRLLGHEQDASCKTWRCFSCFCPLPLLLPPVPS